MDRLGKLAHRLALLALLLSLPSPAAAGADRDADWKAQIAQGMAYRAQGNLQQAIDLLSAAHRAADSAELRARAAGELGIARLQAHRHDDAEAPLKEAHAASAGSARGRYAAYLGNLALYRKEASNARRYYREALALAGDDADTRLSVELNLVRLAPENQRLAQLAALDEELGRSTPAAALARFHLNLGDLARQAGSQGMPLALRNLERARALSEGSEHRRLHTEALAALAQLYEDEKRPAEALTLTRRGLASARQLAAGESADLLIDLEWRAGRLHKALGAPDAALAAWRRAVEQIERVRQDIPVDYEDGRSSFRDTLQPIYLGYADLLLRQEDTGASGDEAVRQARLRSVLDTIELIRQSELQDYLGDRCAVEAVQGGSAGKVPPGTAVLFPLILPDRLELLLETSAGIERRSSPVREGTLRATATRFASLLRNGLVDFPTPARQLHDWLLRPFDDVLAGRGIRSLIVVPDGPLRLVPFAALDDGRRYAIEKYAVSTVTGLSMTNSAPPDERKAASLIAGLSEPGDVVDKLDGALTAQLLDAGSAGESGARGVSVFGILGTRELRSPRAAGSAPREAADLKTRLALPGVKDEVRALAAILPGTRLLDAEFTVRRFSREAESGDYRIVHIASHGVFGGSAETSFIMAHDDLLTMNGLQALLRAEKFQKNPIELLSLSACQTAEGNDRSPLGFSGAAIRARAKSVLGTLWPVEDNAARHIMESLYRGLADGLSKTEALRRAQLALLRQGDSEHPFYWAPFVLIGNWQ